MKKIKLLLKCIRYDISEGLIKLAPLYLLWLVILTAIAVEEWRVFNANVGAPSVIELAIKIFEGMEVYVYVQGGDRLDIPMTYLGFALISAIPAVYYVKREWKQRGAVYISRCCSKGIWWISKCILGIIQVAVFYLETFICIWLVALFGGNNSFAVREAYMAGCERELLVYSVPTILAYIFLLGGISVAVVNQLIMTLQIKFSPAVGYVAAIGFYMAATCSSHVLILGSNIMLARTRIFDESGISLASGCVCLAVCWLLIAAAGYLMIRKKDVL